MLRSFIFLLAPLITGGLFYWAGWVAVAGCVALVFCTLLFSSGTRQPNVTQSTDDTQSSFGPPTTSMAGL